MDFNFIFVFKTMLFQQISLYELLYGIRPPCNLICCYVWIVVH